MITRELNHVTKITFKVCKALPKTNEFTIERDTGRKDGAKQKYMMFFSNEEMLQLQEAITQYNETFVVP
jgi:hypothetical protein